MIINLILINNDTSKIIKLKINRQTHVDTSSDEMVKVKWLDTKESAKHKNSFIIV